jgi:hypothetical protein
MKRRANPRAVILVAALVVVLESVWPMWARPSRASRATASPCRSTRCCRGQTGAKEHLRSRGEGSDFLRAPTTQRPAGRCELHRPPRLRRGRLRHLSGGLLQASRGALERVGLEAPDPFHSVRRRRARRCGLPRDALVPGGRWRSRLSLFALACSRSDGVGPRRPRGASLALTGSNRYVCRRLSLPPGCRPLGGASVRARKLERRRRRSRRRAWTGAAGPERWARRSCAFSATAPCPTDSSGPGRRRAS